MNSIATKLLLFVWLGLTALPGLAETLLGEKSAIQFISVKNAAIAEVHHFGVLTGSIDAQGRADIEIPLVAVDTLIDIRNERMRELFFETNSFPTATIEADIDRALVESLGDGDYLSTQVLLRLTLHGETQMIDAAVSVARLGEELHVVTLKPIILNVADFKLVEGLQRLREIAGLQSIATAVPVTARLVFAP